MYILKIGDMFFEEVDEEGDEGLILTEKKNKADRYTSEHQANIVGKKLETWFPKIEAIAIELN